MMKQLLIAFLSLLALTISMMGFSESECARNDEMRELFEALGSAEDYNKDVLERFVIDDIPLIEQCIAFEMQDEAFLELKDPGRIAHDKKSRFVLEKLKSLKKTREAKELKESLKTEKNGTNTSDISKITTIITVFVVSFVFVFAIV